MTATAGADPHPEVTEIADFSEGLLPPGRRAAVAGHLDGCAICSDVLRSLAEIHELLGTLPGPQRMPADIAGRIDAALAAEALLDATRPAVPRETPPSSSPSPSHDVSRETPPPAPRDVPRETWTGLDILRPGTAGAPDGAGAGRPGTRTDDSRGPGGRGRPPGRRRRRGILAAASALGVLLVGGVVYAATSDGGASRGSQEQARQQAAGSVATIDARVHELLAHAGTAYAGTGSIAPQAPGHADTPMLQPNTDGGGPRGSAPATPVQVPACVLNATHRSQQPMAADHEVFDGTQSYLVVFPHPTDASRVDAFVVSAECGGASPGTVLFQKTYPR